MKEQKTKYIKVRMTSNEVELFKRKAEECRYKTVSHYVREALDEYSNTNVRTKLELIRELGTFYRKFHNELSWAGGNLNQSVKRANELAVVGLLPPSYIHEVLLPTILETKSTLDAIKKGLEEVTKKAVKI